MTRPATARQTSTATVTSPKVAKRQYKPSIQPISDHDYLVPSESYTYVLYQVTVQSATSATCECSAGAHGRVCKHVKLVLGFHAYRQHPSHIRPIAEVAETTPALPAPIDLASRRKPAAAYIPAPADLMECFS